MGSGGGTSGAGGADCTRGGDAGARGGADAADVWHESCGASSPALDRLQQYSCGFSTFVNSDEMSTWAENTSRRKTLEIYCTKFKNKNLTTEMYKQEHILTT